MLDNQGSINTCYVYQQLTALSESKLYTVTLTQIDLLSSICVLTEVSVSVRAMRTSALIDYIYADHDCCDPVLYLSHYQRKIFYSNFNKILILIEKLS
jgi:hypothetical protein